VVKIKENKTKKQRVLYVILKIIIFDVV
jgi:hypothetical protein